MLRLAVRRPALLRAARPAGRRSFLHAGAMAEIAEAGVKPGDRVAVGVSGGVDSAVTALLLREYGAEVVGVHMTNWDENEEGAACTGEADRKVAKAVCESLGVELAYVEFVKEYWNDVFLPFMSQCEAGYTPNPDITCNREIKFGVFLEHARERLRCDWVATGHYSRVLRPPAAEDGGRPAPPAKLLRGIDPTKDQSYFLSMVRAHRLDRVLMPLGAMHKREVREIATAAGLINADRRDSMGICFIGKRDFRGFIGQYLPTKTGIVRAVDDFSPIGDHEGMWSFTLGQSLRHGGMRQKYYIVAKDVPRNEGLAAPGRDHPAGLSVGLICGPASWIAGSMPYAIRSNRKMRLTVRTRHMRKEVPCYVSKADPERHRFSSLYMPQHSDRGPDRKSIKGVRKRVPFTVADAMKRHGKLLYVELDEPEPAITPGQVAVFYDGEVCLGGAVTVGPGPTLLDMEALRKGRPVPSFEEELRKFREKEKAHERAKHRDRLFRTLTEDERTKGASTVHKELQTPQMDRWWPPALSTKQRIKWHNADEVEAEA